MKRKIKLLDGRVESYWKEGENNPCGCGSNLYHLENDEKDTYGVCNCCDKDIYIYNEKVEFKEWKYK